MIESKYDFDLDMPKIEIKKYARKDYKQICKNLSKLSSNGKNKFCKGI